MPDKGRTQAQLKMPRGMRKGEPVLFFNIRTGELDPDKLRAKGSVKLADELTLQTKNESKFYAKRKLIREKNKQTEMKERKMYESTGNSERDIYDMHKQLIFNDYRKHPFSKFIWAFFGLENDEVEPFIAFPLDFDEIIKRGLNHHSIGCFKKTKRFQFEKA